MNKNTMVRWILDIMVTVCVIYAGWSFRQFTKLNENDIIQRTQLESVNQSVGALNETLRELTESINGQNSQLQALIVMSTVRSDPWSGKMMVEFQSEWFDIMRPILPDLTLSDIPDVYQIQKNHAKELLPKGL